MIAYLGLTIDTTLMILTLLEGKVQKITRECRIVLHKDKVSMRNLSRLIGMMSVTTQAVIPAPLHYEGSNK